jgi:hypothetical protein
VHVPLEKTDAKIQHRKKLVTVENHNAKKNIASASMLRLPAILTVNVKVVPILITTLIKLFDYLYFHCLLKIGLSIYALFCCFLLIKTNYIKL